ncbi:hypothetical protein CHUAL_001791 [Chamberlinius hualienensis]
MRAVRVHAFGGPEVLKIEKLSIPLLTENQVLMSVEAIGINPLDVAIRSGTHVVKPELPYIPGRDAAGIVKAVGANVTNIRVGQRVYTNGAAGAYAELTVAPSDRVFALSNKLTFDQGAALGAPYFTAYRALFMKAQSKSGESVLIHGASGGVGLAAVQLAKAHGMTVFATVGSQEGDEIVKACGADHVFNHKDKDYVDRITTVATGGVNVILEMLADVNLLTDLMKLSAFQARIIIIGSRGTIPEFAPRLVMGKELSIIGCAFLLASKHDWSVTADAITDGIEKGYIDPKIAQIYPLEDIAKAHSDLMNSNGAKGKLIVKLQQRSQF